jgi:fucose permease
MPTRGEVGLVYGAGLVQGVALVAFPAASSIFTSPQEYGFSSSQYGALFLPQVALAILASSLAPAFARRWSLKRVLVIGLGADLVSMTLLALSSLFMSAGGLAYGLLLLATAALGLGFGATVTALNTFAEAFYPARADDAVLALNALLGTGTALAPLFVAVFLGLGAWWLLPLLVAAALVALVLLSVRTPLHTAADRGAAGRAQAGAGILPGLPRRFWLYAAMVLLYGIVETLNGNWSTLYLTQQRGVPTQWASLALAAFWAMVTGGRVLVAFASSRVPSRWIYPGLPALLVVAFFVVARVTSAIGGIVAFGFAGLACSAMLPLSISFGGTAFPHQKAVVSGDLLAVYQVGYGIAAFGVGPLHAAGGVPLSSIYAGASLIAGAMIVLALLVAKSLSATVASAAASPAN